MNASLATHALGKSSRFALLLVCGLVLSFFSLSSASAAPKPTPPPIVEPINSGPDLAFTLLWYYDYDGIWRQHYAIINQGRARSPESFFRIWTDAPIKNVYDIAIPRLDVGSSYDTGFTSFLPSCTALKINPDQAFFEMRWDNNSLLFWSKTCGPSPF